MSSSGSPRTAIRSASYPTATFPIRDAESQERRGVDGRREERSLRPEAGARPGVPPRRRSSIVPSTGSAGCPSVPWTIVTPWRIAVSRLRACIGSTSAARRTCDSSNPRASIQLRTWVTLIVGVRNAPARDHPVRGLVVQLVAVLEAAHPGIQRELDRGRVPGVRHHVRPVDLGGA